nr:methyltransferase domain-containing protein [uncultured Schaedlerella sp.]
MSDSRIKEYLAQIGIRRVHELDTALLEAFGQEEGEKHIKKLTELYDRSEERLVYGSKDTAYLRRQEELVDYLNQSLQMSLLAASFYDRVFFRRAMEALLRYEQFFAGNILDIGCGNGILTCFLARIHPDASVTGLDLSQMAVSAAQELAGRLQADKVHFAGSLSSRQKKYDTVFSCRTVHENVKWKPLIEEKKEARLSMEEQSKRYEGYVKELSALVKPQGYFVSIERCEEDDVCAGLICALAGVGLCQVKGTCMQFSCKNGDEMAAFQAMVFQKADG